MTPAMMAMAVLLQEYAGVSDAEAVELTVMDKRWQLVLGRLGESKPAFSQGAFWDFRERLLRHDMDRRLLERTGELARKTKGFDWKKLPARVRVAMDSSPLEGAGRVEDTLNLLAYAARKIVTCAAGMLDVPFEQIVTQAGIPLLLASSVKVGLDRRWENPGAVNEALGELIEQLDSLQAWVEQRFPDAARKPPLHEHLQTLAAIRTQDLEPDPTDPSRPRIRQGTAPYRRISIADSEMRHGRKSQSRKFNGFKRHLAVDLDTGLILACVLAPANRPEREAATMLNDDIERQGVAIDALYIDRGYIASSLVQDVLDRSGAIICRPWNVSNDNGRFSKADFHINLRDRLITCPGGQTEPFQFGQTVTFDAHACATCSLRSRCTNAVRTEDVPSTSRTTNRCSDVCADRQRRRPDVNSYESASPSSTNSHTSLSGKVTARVTVAPARTSSTCVERLPSRTWKSSSTDSKDIAKPHEPSCFKAVGVLDPGFRSTGGLRACASRRS